MSEALAKNNPNHDQFWLNQVLAPRKMVDLKSAVAELATWLPEQVLLLLLWWWWLRRGLWRSSRSSRSNLPRSSRRSEPARAACPSTAFHVAPRRLTRRTRRFEPSTGDTAESVVPTLQASVGTTPTFQQSNRWIP